MYFKVQYRGFLLALDNLESVYQYWYELVVLRIITYQINIHISLNLCSHGDNSFEQIYN